MSQSDPLFWGTIESGARHMLLLPTGMVPDEEARNIYRKVNKDLIMFFWSNNLLKKIPFCDGEFIDQEYRKSDFTEEGIEMLKRRAERWLDTKGAEKDPPNYKILEKLLAEIRAERAIKEAS